MGDRGRKNRGSTDRGKSGLAACYAAGVAAGMTIADIDGLQVDEFEAIMKEIAEIWKT